MKIVLKTWLFARPPIHRESVPSWSVRQTLIPPPFTAGWPREVEGPCPVTMAACWLWRHWSTTSSSSVALRRISSVEYGMKTRATPRRRSLIARTMAKINLGVLMKESMILLVARLYFTVSHHMIKGTIVFENNMSGKIIIAIDLGVVNFII